MGEQRPMFRFRLPWMISSAPAPPPPVAAQRPQQPPLATPQPQTKIEPSMNPIMPVRRPFRLSSIALAQPPPPIQPAVESQSERITITSTPRTLPQASPIWSPKVSAAQDPRPQAEIPPEIKSQTENSFLPASTSPSRSHSPPTQLPSSPPSPQLRAASQLPSPQLRATSHPPSPRHIPSQEQDTSQLPSPKSPKSGPHPSSPRPASSKASDASQTSSPSRTSSKVRDASQPSSPDRTHFLKSSQPETFQQPRSPPQFQSSGQKSPITSSPSLTASNVQQTTPQSPPRAEPPSSTFQPQTNIEPNVNPTTPVQRPFRFAGTAPAQPPPPIQPTVQSQSQSKPITITSGPAFPPQAPPSWFPKISAAKDPLPQPEVSVDSKSQTQNSSKPISPSKTNSQATSQLPSPSLASAQSSATSQLPYRPSASPQPPSPWPALSQERETTRFPSSKSSPQPSSPWSESSKAKDSSQQSSPDRHQFQKPSQAETVQQPRSPSKLDFQPWKKTSPITSSPSLTPTNVQQTERTTRLPSPSIMSAHMKSLQPSASSDKPPSPLSVKPSVAVSQPQSQEDQSKTKFTPSVTKGTAQPADNVAKPPKRDIEMVPNTSLVAQEEPKQRRMAVQFTETSELTSHNKEKLKIESQAEHNQLKNQHLDYGKEGKIPKASSLDEKQTKTKTSQQTDKKSTISESRKKLMKSNEDRVPFQEQLRDDIFKFANKLAFAHTENSKDEQLASVIALAGKNKGALMKLGSVSAKGEETHGANETEPVEGTKENERNGSAKRRSSNNKIDQENQIQKTFVNNNVQDINNSLLMNSSITERNPGVHLALYYDPTEPIMSYDRKGSSEARKGKSRSPIPKSFAYEPTI
ncbi:hypothetical protein POM88_005490 [Heracleum sosnowskyi]|uniref:Uncharacterized protein n=1 Tax=Heracleum sosnowskyi TaxID=360622 RepID=A0AAD8N4D5_9APIA|nr:hypothetical protein POM88_005490 [Heracleum sosnowskyi]